jgi:hypothetical protein
MSDSIVNNSITSAHFSNLHTPQGKQKVQNHPIKDLTLPLTSLSKGSRVKRKTRIPAAEVMKRENLHAKGCGGLREVYFGQMPLLNVDEKLQNGTKCLKENIRYI